MFNFIGENIIHVTVIGHCRKPSVEYLKTITLQSRRVRFLFILLFLKIPADNNVEGYYGFRAVKMCAFYNKIRANIKLLLLYRAVRAYRKGRRWR